MMERDWRKQCAELAAEDAARAGKSRGSAGAAGPADDSSPFNLWVPRSCCPSCKALIRARHNIPLVSYLMLRGRCASCGARISLRYPIVELVTGLLSGVVA